MISTGIKDSLIDATNTILAVNPIRKVIIIGHSLGGALGLFWALDFLQICMYLFIQFPYQAIDGVSPELWTYGAPRVGNMLFSEYVYSSLLSRWVNVYYFLLFIISWRIVNIADIVPHLPPQFIGYEHITT
jgi:predicted lipase